MLGYYILCKSITFARRTAFQLERSGIKSVINRAPYSLSADGCGYSVKIPNQAFERAMSALRGTELMPRKVYRMTEQGVYEEVLGR